MASITRKKKTFVIGDIHGAHKALVQVLKRAKFSYLSDTLIVLGDTCDGWYETRNVLMNCLK